MVDERDEEVLGALTNIHVEVNADIKSGFRILFVSISDGAVE